MMRFVSVICSLFLLFLFFSSGNAANYTVKQLTDCNFPDPQNPTNYCLRTAISAANQNSDFDVINVPAGTYILDIDGAGEDNNLTGDLDITDSVWIIGEGPDKTIIEGGVIDRVIDIHNPSQSITVYLANLTIQNGRVPADSTEGGGGIQNNETLSLINVVVNNNVASIADISSANRGGGILNTNGGSLYVRDSVISNNDANAGGGLYVANGTEVEVKRSLLFGNQAYAGGAISSYGHIDFENVTIDHNSADGNIGAVDINSTAVAHINFCTITANISNGTFPAVSADADSTISLDNTILAGNVSTYDSQIRNCSISSATVSGSYNLEDADTCGLSPVSNMIDTDPKLGVLANNGGPTKTRALLSGSPAIDAVKTTISVTEDQRKKKRPQGAYADIGAFEYVPPVCFPIRAENGRIVIICM